MRIDPADLPPDEAPKALASLRRFRLEQVTEPGSRAFEAAWQAMDAYFGPSGELESPETLARFVSSPVIDYAPGLEGRYTLIVAWEGDTLVGVRDAYVDLDLNAGVCVAALSHVWLAPHVRRQGLASVMRALPASLARELVAQRFPDPSEIETLVVAEMEPPCEANAGELARLFAYGRSGFKALDPWRFPYSQPDFRDPLPADAAHTALPMLMLARWLDHPGVSALPLRLVASIPRLFYLTHRMSLPASRVDPSERHLLRQLHACTDDVPLWTLPRGPDDLERLSALVRSAVLEAWPPGLRGEDDRPGQPEADLDALRIWWRAQELRQAAQAG